jgi:DNA-binding NarL/FixJ family response regulator
VADHPLAARFLRRVLECETDLEVINGVEDFAGHRVRQMAPILIIDTFALPPPLAQYLRAVSSAFKDPRILVIGKPVSDDELCRLLFHGISGFVIYDKIEEEICAAVDALRRGHVWVSPQVLERYVILSSGLARQKRREHGTLSPRENEIVGLLQQRLSNKEIGCALVISERTVRFHLQNVFDKLGVRDRHGVAELARVSGLVGPETAEKTDRRAPDRLSAVLQKWPAAA